MSDADLVDHTMNTTNNEDTVDEFGWSLGGGGGGGGGGAGLLQVRYTHWSLTRTHSSLTHSHTHQLNASSSSSSISGMGRVGNLPLLTGQGENSENMVGPPFFSSLFSLLHACVCVVIRSEPDSKSKSN
jgi:hypothetical protein